MSARFGIGLGCLALIVGMISAPARGADLTEAQREALVNLAQGEQFIQWPGIREAQAEALYEEAIQSEQRMEQYLMPHGQVCEVWWSDRERSEPFKYEGLGDSAKWVGIHLGAMVFKYNVEPTTETYRDIADLLDIFDMLTQISGRDGYVARYAGPKDSKPYQEYYSVYGKGEDPERPGLGHRAFLGVEPWQDQVWLGWASRDTYDGTIVGLTMAMARLEGAPELQAQARKIHGRICDRLIADDFNIIDPKGFQTRGTPLFKAAWMRSMLTNDPEKYGHLKDEYADLIMQMAQRETRVYPMDYREYFAQTLTFDRYLVLSMLEEDPVLEKLIDQVVRQAFDKTKSHLNAYFAAVYALGTGNGDEEEARALIQGLLIDFREGTQWAIDLDRTDEVEMMEGSDEYAKYAQLPSERPLHDFIWQVSPALVKESGRGHVPWECPPLDIIMPYWMGRMAGAIPAPDKAEMEGE